MTLSDLQAFFKTPLVVGALLYVVTLFGAAVVNVLKLRHDFEGSVAFFKKIFPGKSETFYSRLDFVVVSLVGSIIGMIVFQPSNAIQALSAGFGWVSSLNVLLAGRTQPGDGARGVP